MGSHRTARKVQPPVQDIDIPGLDVPLPGDLPAQRPREEPRRQQQERDWPRMEAAAHAGSAAGACAAALSAATAGHRQLVLQLGGSADCARLREERRRSSARARRLGDGLRRALLAGLRGPPGSAEERRELERLWLLLLSALELLLQDLRKAQHLGELFGTPSSALRTGLAGRPPGSRWRWMAHGAGRGPALLPAARRPEEEEQEKEEVEAVRAMLAEMESRANIPPWSVEARPDLAGDYGAVGLCCGLL
ncbi:regulator of G-protein signaling 9-binding protein-like [Eudromia elegans]